MNRLSHLRLWRLAVLLGGLSTALISQADAVSAVQLLREGGCGGILPAAQPLHRNPLLDRAAEQWAAGLSPAAAAAHSGYQAEATAALHIAGPDASTVELLRRANCRSVSDRRLRDIGVYHRGMDTWLVLASAYALPASSQAPVLTTRALELVNEARAPAEPAAASIRSDRRRPYGCPSLWMMSRTDMRPTWPGTAILNTRIWRGARRRSGSRPSDTGKNWWVRTSHTVRNQPKKWYEAGSTAPDTAKTSWTPDSPRWASLMRRARLPGVACIGFSFWPRPELSATVPVLQVLPPKATLAAHALKSAEHDPVAAEPNVTRRRGDHAASQQRACPHWRA